MAFRLYVVPIVGAGTRVDPRRPKYFASDAAGGGAVSLLSGPRLWSAVVYGFEPVCIVGADLTIADDATVAGQADVHPLPFNLSATLTSGQVSAVQSFLEAGHIPGGWVTTDLTWTQVARTVLGVFSFFQRFATTYAAAIGQPPQSVFAANLTLDTTFGSLPAAVRSALSATAQAFGFSTAGVTGATTLRVILKAMADNFQGRPFSFNGAVI